MMSAPDQFTRRLRAARNRLIRTNINDPALDVCISGLARVEEALSRPLRVVVLGEYNSGKTSVADLLIGEGLLPTSVVANTHVPVLISYAPSPAVFGVDQDATRIRIDSDNDDPLTDLSFRALQVALPLDRLKSYQVLDTPSSATPATFVGDADIVIWCTVATRAWTESERAAWASLPQRCTRNALLVATHKDGLQTDEECNRVAERLRDLTRGLFRDVILVAAEGAEEDAAGGTPNAARNGADALREGLDRIAADIGTRRTQKAEKIVRRLARLTFHHFASAEVRPELMMLLSAWETHAGRLLDLLAQGRKTAPDTIQDLLISYAYFAEVLRPGVVTGDSIPAASPASRALTAPVRWPAQNTAAARLVRMLASDLTGLLRMLSGSSAYTDPAVQAEYQTARAIVLALADLDGAFDALSRMIGASAASGRA